MRVPAAVFLAETDKLTSGRDLLKAVRERSNLNSEPAFTEKGVRIAEAPAKKRVIHFPKDRSLGALSVPCTGLDVFGEWEYLYEAKGDVIVPADKMLELRVSKPGVKSLSKLSSVGPNDIQRLVIHDLDNTIHKPDETVMPYLGHLTGLKELEVDIDISGRGLRFIKG